jgi:hypothetical protein
MKEWLPAGTVIAHFRISSRISANGAGEVYQATEAPSGAELALKLLPSVLVEDLVESRAVVGALSESGAGYGRADGSPFGRVQFGRGFL